MPLVSVVVPNYNHARFLEERVESILGQTFRDYELILLDDGSGDGSREMILRYGERFPRIRVYLNDRNGGSPFRQWDFGVRQAAGGYVWIAESDDAAAPTFLEETVPVLEDNPRVGLCYCDTRTIDEGGRTVDAPAGGAFPSGEGETCRRVAGGRDEIENGLCAFNTIRNASGVLFRKSDYLRAGPADQGMRYCGDWFLYLRILLSADVGHVAKPLNRFRVHAGSTVHRYYADDLYLREVLRVYRYLMENLSLPPRSRKRIHDEISRHFCLSLKKGCLPSGKVLRGMREAVPFFGFCLAAYLAGRVVRKCVL